MTENEKYREILEPEAPRLDEAAAARIDAAVADAIARRSRRRWRLAWTLPALGVPALALILLLIFRPFGPGNDEGAPRLALLNEEQLIARLEELLDEGSDPELVYYGEDTDFTDYDDTNWTDDDWSAFRTELEAFQLSDRGETR